MSLTSLRSSGPPADARRGTALSGLLLLAALGPVGCSSKPLERPNVILITMDTTRVDRLGCYGYERPTSPNLDELAGESVVFSNAVATASWTLPSHASLFTGKLTYSHGARSDPDGSLMLGRALAGPGDYSEDRARGLGPHEVTLAQLFRDAGYRTGAVVAGPWLKKVFGWSRGFDVYDDRDITRYWGRVASQVTTAASELIDTWRDEKFFLFLNYFDPHEPYSPPEGYVRTFLPAESEIDARYDSEILYMDRYLGELFRKLKQAGLYDDTWIIVTADHGELLGEHGTDGHGEGLYQEEIHVPLIVKYPAGEKAARRVDAQVQLIDILPMIAERLGFPVPDGVQGQPPDRVGHPIVSELYHAPRGGDWRAIFEDDYKLIVRTRERPMLFRLSDDPRESENLASRDPERSTRMASRLETYLAGLPEPEPPGPEVEIDEETAETLKSLGYVD